MAVGKGGIDLSLGKGSVLIKNVPARFGIGLGLWGGKPWDLGFRFV